ncbi:MAG: hypothetical protein ACQERD_07265 [Campylobacterota bacterium]
MNFTDSLHNHIDKLVGILKDEDELQQVLKKKFTKKEFKAFVAFEQGKDLKEVCDIVKDNEKRVEELYKSACKKVNQEKIKNELIRKD